MLEIIQKMKDLDFLSLTEIYRDNKDIFPESVSGITDSSLRGLESMQQFYRYLCDVFFFDPASFYAVWKMNGMYVSAVRFEPYNDGLLMASLETEPTFRSKGYATMLVMSALKCIPESYSCVYSHVASRNFSSIQLHKRCGFREISKSAKLLDGSYSVQYHTYLWQK